MTYRFQSTHSLRSATVRYGPACFLLEVSIHALLAECDIGIALEGLKWTVSIHALLAECDSTGETPQQ